MVVKLTREALQPPRVNPVQHGPHMARNMHVHQANPAALGVEIQKGTNSPRHGHAAGRTTWEHGKETEEQASSHIARAQ